MKVIGTIGRNGSGKDELVRYLHRQCGIPVISVGEIVRENAKKEGIEPNRENLHYISRQQIQRYGIDYFMNEVINRIEKEKWTAVGITGIRTPADVMTLRNRFGRDFFLVHVDVSDPAVRFDRMTRRGESRDPQSYEEFLRQDREEEELFNIDEALKHADAVILNDDTREDLYEEIRNLISTPTLSSEVVCR